MNNDFEKYGFTHLGSFYSPTEVEEISRIVEDITTTNPREGYYEKSVHNGEDDILVRMEKILSLDSRLNEIFQSKKIISLLEKCLGDTPSLFKDKVNYKLPGNRADLLHQDQQAGWSTYSPYFVTLCVCLDANTSLNGCLQLPDKHKYTHRYQIYGTPDSPLELKDIPDLSLVEYESAPGDIFLFDSYVPHASNPNNSKDQRRNIYLTYNRKSQGSHHSLYYEDKYQSYPPNAYRNNETEYSYKV